MHGLWAMQREQLIEQIYSAIEPFDVADLSDRQRRNWYPVNAQDLHNAAYKGARRSVSSSFYVAQVFHMKGK